MWWGRCRTSRKGGPGLDCAGLAAGAGAEAPAAAAAAPAVGGAADTEAKSTGVCGRAEWQGGGLSSDVETLS